MEVLAKSVKTLLGKSSGDAPESPPRSVIATASPRRRSRFADPTAISTVLTMSIVAAMYAMSFDRRVRGLFVAEPAKIAVEVKRDTTIDVLAKEFAESLEREEAVSRSHARIQGRWQVIETIDGTPPSNDGAGSTADAMWKSILNGQIWEFRGSQLTIKKAGTDIECPGNFALFVGVEPKRIFFYATKPVGVLTEAFRAYTTSEGELLNVCFMPSYGRVTARTPITGFVRAAATRLRRPQQKWCRKLVPMMETDLR